MPGKSHILNYTKHSRKFDVPQTNQTESERASGVLSRVVVEEHLYWFGATVKTIL